MMNIFAKISKQLEIRLDRVKNKLYALEAEIVKVDEEIATSTGTKKIGLQARRTNLQEKYNKETKKYAAIYSSKHAMGFVDDLFGSFKTRWIPIVATVILIMGPFTSVSSFFVGTLINLLLLFGVLGIIMYAMKLRGVIPEVDTKDKKSMLVAKGIFLALTVAKVLYTVLGPGLMVAIVVIGAVAVGLYIERDDLKTLIERWKDENSGDKKDGE